ncbi:hypothetical protein Bhyg_07564 [Pseudolycoriella hygida]|uniref:Uncharacterized protein n=1 Tax=Pseudolycoriella hygida TaxID=35572 RepID=A0A9Q0N3W3_9DIPT|nr:hypothetical protein Bhyg_07564 [Pseudolycoriella hygida]
MVKICCCICYRRTDTNRQRSRIGAPALWPLFMIHVEKTGLDINQFSRDDYVCMKCNLTISHYRMNDRGINKKIKLSQPFSYEVAITKSVLRNSIATSSTDTLEGEEQTNSDSNLNEDLTLSDISDASASFINTNISNNEVEEDDQQSKEPTSNNEINIPEQVIIVERSDSENNVLTLDDILSNTVIDSSPIIDEQRASSYQQQQVELPNAGFIHFKVLKILKVDVLFANLRLEEKPYRGPQFNKPGSKHVATFQS